MGINLEKGQKIDLKKQDGGQLTKVFMGLGWDVANNGPSIDLDASCALFSDTNQLIDTVSFRKLRSDDGSIRHSGDNLTGAGDGDDEVINVDLSIVPQTVKTIAFTINSFGGQNFSKIANCFARLVDAQNNNEICIYKLADSGSHTGMIMCKIYRHNGNWKFAAIGQPCNGRTISDIANDIQRCL